MGRTPYFGQCKFVWDLVRSFINFSKRRILLKLRETVRKRECPEDVESGRCMMYCSYLSHAVNECVCIIRLGVCM